MKRTLGVLVFVLAFVSLAALAQDQPAPTGTNPTKTTYLSLSNNANAILVEPVTLDPVRSRILVIVIHPDRINNFNYFIGVTLPQYGYRTMMVNYYGQELNYYEFLRPIAAAVKAARAVPGVEKVLIAGHSTGGAEVSSYQVVAENGPSVCQVPERIVKCDPKGIESLPKVDGLMLIDANSGAPEKTIGINPAVDGHNPHIRHPELDMFSPANGYDPKKPVNYSPEFLNRFFAAQAAKANQMIDDALARLVKIQKGEGDYKDDEPYIVSGSAIRINGARPELADLNLLSKTHAPHMVLKADGSRPTEIVHQVYGNISEPETEDTLAGTTLHLTVKQFLSVQALRVTKDYRENEDSLQGIIWNTTANSIQGNITGIHVPTLVLSATCAAHMELLETAYDLSPAKDKTFVGLEGANHGLQPCRPEFGDTYKRGFDYIDEWISKPGRF
jgi:pimeloyl-ACP methyl ester carboxylesterase